MNKSDSYSTLSKLLFIILFFFLLSISTISRLVLDYRWFESLGYTQVFTVTLKTKLLLFIIGFTISFLILYLSWRWCEKTLLTTSTPQPLWERLVQASREYIDVTPQMPVRKTLDVLHKPLIIAFLILSLIAGMSLSSRWDTVLLYLHRAPFGTTDPVFGVDIGFYIFTLPFIHTLLNYFLGLLIITALITTLAYLSLNWRFVLEHMPLNLRLLLALVFLLLSVKTYLSRFNILYSTTGVVYGAGYVDVHINQYIPVLTSLLLLATAISLILLPLLKSHNLSVKLPLIAVALIILVSILGGSVSWFVQEFRVSPNEIVLEEPFIQYNINMTNDAYALSGITERKYTISYNLTPEDLNSPTIKNIRLWDYRPLLTTFQQRQEIRTYYGFSNIVVDRYLLNGELTQVWMAIREILPDKLQGTADTWINKHLIYTHGIGVVLAPVNHVDSQGLPVMLIRDIPPKIEATGINLTQPRIYYGEQTSYYVITNTNREEFDYPAGDENRYTTYQGSGGILLTPLNKLASAIALGELKLYTSEYITENSKLHLYRNIQERARKITPYILFDSDPHAFISRDGRIYWMLSGFVTTDSYPYSQPLRFNGQRLNYLRDSLKVIIDAYNGTTTYYIIRDDPILQAYASIYPGLFKPFKEMPEDMKAHLRYSEDLFNIQTSIYTVYHMKRPEVFYNKEDRWEVPTEKYETAEIKVQPYNVLLELDGKLNFLTMLPFTPVNRDNMIAWMAVKQDPPEYGELTVFKFTKEEQIYGPSQIEARIDQDESISKDLTLWGQSGSRVIRGNLLVIPYKNSILYIEPLYLAAETGSIPELKRVIVFYNNTVVMEPSLGKALKRVIRAENRTLPVVLPEHGVDITSLINQTLQHYEAAKQALMEGDLEIYGREMKKVDELLLEIKKRIK